jgi:aspartate racemase
MKRIALLGGTSWPSTIEYYRMFNQMVADRLGGYHSADLILRSIDYHPIKSRYHEGWDVIPQILEREVRFTLSLPCDGLILCCCTLHKAFDLIREPLSLSVPFFHAVELTASHAREKGMTRLLLLGTRFTMEDGFFEAGLRRAGLEVSVPDARERQEIQAIQSRLAAGENRPEFSEYFADLLGRYSQTDAAILGCTELPLAITPQISPLPLIDPAKLQVSAAVDFVLA